MTEPVNPAVNNETELPPANTLPSYTEWTRQVMDRLAEDEKRWIELASEQSSLMLKAIRQGLEFYRSFPMPPMLGWAREGTRQFFETQQVPNPEGATPPAEAATAATQIPAVKPPFETLLEYRNAWLEFLSRQNRQFLDLMQESMGLRSRMPAMPPDGEAATVPQDHKETVLN